MFSVKVVSRKFPGNFLKAVWQFHVTFVAGYFSLSSSHATAFLRCLQHGCPCPENEPPLDVPKSDPCWDLITKGWSWLVIGHEVEAALPSLPAFLAMASNSTNSISAASNELECAMMLAHYHKCGIPMTDAIARVRAGGIQCQLATSPARYLGQVPDFAQLLYL